MINVDSHRDPPITNKMNHIFSAGTLMTSAGRRAANAEENPLEHFDDKTIRQLHKNKIPNDDLVFNLNKILP